MAHPVAQAAKRVTHELHGVVVSAGLMQKTVKVRVGKMTWNKSVKKHFSEPQNFLVHDPNSSLRTGDVISIVPGWRSSQHKRHIVKQILAPYGTPIEERPPIPTLEERLADYDAKKAAKDERRSLRKHAAAEQSAEERTRKREAMVAKMSIADREQYLLKRKEREEKKKKKARLVEQAAEAELEVLAPKLPVSASIIVDMDEQNSEGR